MCLPACTIRFNQMRRSTPTLAMDLSRLLGRAKRSIFLRIAHTRKRQSAESYLQQSLNGAEQDCHGDFRNPGISIIAHLLRASTNRSAVRQPDPKGDQIIAKQWPTAGQLASSESPLAARRQVPSACGRARNNFLPRFTTLISAFWLTDCEIRTRSPLRSRLSISSCPKTST
jgi:hypothetical protein